MTVFESYLGSWPGVTQVMSFDVELSSSKALLALP